MKPKVNFLEEGERKAGGEIQVHLLESFLPEIGVVELRF